MDQTFKDRLLGRKYKPLPPDKELELIKKAQNGDIQARNEVILANIRLVASVAGRYGTCDCEFDDMLHEGVIGMITAIKKYDPEAGAKFSTYAIKWIRQSINHALTYKGHMIRTPAKWGDEMRRLAEYKTKKRAETGREMTLEELAEETGIPLKKIQRYMDVTHRGVSLDAHFNDDEKQDDLMSVTEDDKVSDPEDEAIKSCLRDTVLEMFDRLPTRDAEIFKLRIGWDTGAPETLRAIAKKYGLTAEGVRRIEQRTLDKLRKPSNRIKLIDFYY